MAWRLWCLRSNTLRRILFAFCMAVAGGVCADAHSDEPYLDGIQSGERAVYAEFLLRVAAVEGDPLSDLAVSRALALFSKNTPNQDQHANLRRQSERLQERAHATGDNPEIWALRVMTGDLPEVGSPDRAHLLQVMEAAVSDNAFFAVILLDLPEYRDPAHVELLLQRAAQAQRYRSIYVAVARSLNARVLDAVRTHGVPSFSVHQGISPETFAFEFVLGYNAAIALPGYRRFLDSCGDTAFDRLRADCRNMATVMSERADTLIDVAIAHAALKRLAKDDEEFAVATALRRQSVWIQVQASSLLSKMIPEDDGPWNAEQDANSQRYARSWLADGEVVALRQLVRDAGIAEHPPEDWRPEFEQAAPAER
jgi:hypothetical protein